MAGSRLVTPELLALRGRSVSVPNLGWHGSSPPSPRKLLAGIRVSRWRSRERSSPTGTRSQVPVSADAQSRPLAFSVHGPPPAHPGSCRWGFVLDPVRAASPRRTEPRGVDVLYAGRWTSGRLWQRAKTGGTLAGSCAVNSCARYAYPDWAVNGSGAGTPGSLRHKAQVSQRAKAACSVVSMAGPLSGSKHGAAHVDHNGLGRAGRGRRELNGPFPAASRLARVGLPRCAEHLVLHPIRTVRHLRPAGRRPPRPQSLLLAVDLRRRPSTTRNLR